MANLKKITLAFAAAAAMTFGGCAMNEAQSENMVASEWTPSEACSTEIQDHFKSLTEKPEGDGHDVIVLPGFSSNNFFTKPLRDALSERGYTVHAWAGDYNSGPNAEDAKAFEEQVLKLYEDNGNKKISLVGHSLGGVYARELARAHPDKIRSVVTLGSPIELKEADGRVNVLLQQVSDFYNEGASPTDPLDVPTSSFLSDWDKVVNWKDALNKDTDKAENVVVHMGHVVMPRTELTYDIVAERLTYKTDTWKPLADLYCKPKPQLKTTP